MNDYDKINSATKYPSIETYHQLDPKRGDLLESPMLFDGDTVYLTEKVDGTNGRIIVMPDGDWYIGSREEIFYARGDRIINPHLSIVETLLPLAKSLPNNPSWIQTFYLEVFGGGIGQSYKNYTTSKRDTGYRMFDMSYVSTDILELERDRIASWRDHGGQKYAHEFVLNRASNELNIPLVPRIGKMAGADLPRTIDETHAWLKYMLPKTNVALDDTGRGMGEGLVVRTSDRVTIAKARFQDYERTIRRRK